MRPGQPAQPQTEPFDLKEEIKKEKVVVKREKYGRPRRDPFTNPLTKKLKEGAVRQRGPREVPVDEQEELLEQIAKDIEKLESLTGVGDLKVVLALSRKVESDIEDVKWAAQFEERVEELRQKFEAQKAAITAEQRRVLYEACLKIVAQMTEAFTLNEFDEVRALYKSVDNMLKDVESLEEDPRLHQLSLHAQGLLERADNKEKLLNMKLNISGILWTPEERTAIVNGTEVAEGDTLPQGVVVRNIEQDSITFEYKKETDRRTMLGY
jgi:hypothetical protein